MRHWLLITATLLCTLESSRVLSYVVGPLKIFDTAIAAPANQKPASVARSRGQQVLPTSTAVDDSIIYFPSDEDQHTRLKRNSDNIVFPDLYPQTAVQSDRIVRQDPWGRGPQIGGNNNVPRPWGNQGFNNARQQNRPGGFPSNNWGDKANNFGNNRPWDNNGGDDDDYDAPFVFDRPPVVRPQPGGGGGSDGVRPRPGIGGDRPSPNIRPPKKRPTTTTPRPLPGGPFTSPTPASTRRNCNCPSTPEFNPVCGQDRVTYSNPGKLRCANFCGNRVQMLHHGACITTTTAPPPSG